jgi:hypothetical protein
MTGRLLASMEREKVVQNVVERILSTETRI